MRCLNKVDAAEPVFGSMWEVIFLGMYYNVAWRYAKAATSFKKDYGLEEASHVAFIQPSPRWIFAKQVWKKIGRHHARKPTPRRWFVLCLP